MLHGREVKRCGKAKILRIASKYFVYSKHVLVNVLKIDVRSLHRFVFTFVIQRKTSTGRIDDFVLYQVGASG